MALGITHRDVDRVAVVLLDGRIVLGEETKAFREKVKSLLAEGKKNILLDFRNISFIDSAGLDALVKAYSSAKSAGAALRLCNVGSKFRELLQITKLCTVFEVSDSEAEAVRVMAQNVSAD